MADLKQYGTYDRKVQSAVVEKATSEEVDNFHTNSDVDLRAESQHHTLGPNPSQASPGNHTHDGGSSPLILNGETITGKRGTEAYFLSVNAILVRLGAKDSSTA